MCDWIGPVVSAVSGLVGVGVGGAITWHVTRKRDDIEHVRRILWETRNEQRDAALAFGKFVDDVFARRWEANHPQLRQIADESKRAEQVRYWMEIDSRELVNSIGFAFRNKTFMLEAQEALVAVAVGAFGCSEEELRQIGERLSKIKRDMSDTTRTIETKLGVGPDLLDKLPG